MRNALERASLTGSPMAGHVTPTGQSCDCGPAARVIDGELSSNPHVSAGTVANRI